MSIANNAARTSTKSSSSLVRCRGRPCASRSTSNWTVRGPMSVVRVRMCLRPTCGGAAESLTTTKNSGMSVAARRRDAEYHVYGVGPGGVSLVADQGLRLRCSQDASVCYDSSSMARLAGRKGRLDRRQITSSQMQEELTKSLSKNAAAPLKGVASAELAVSVVARSSRTRARERSASARTSPPPPLRSARSRASSTSRPIDSSSESPAPVGSVRTRASPATRAISCSAGLRIMAGHVSLPAAIKSCWAVRVESSPASNVRATPHRMLPAGERREVDVPTTGRQSQTEGPSG